MTPAQRLDVAEDGFDGLNLSPNDPNFVCLQALIAIGRLLQNIDNRQQGQEAS